MKPLISCIVPTLNYGRFLKEAVDSILAQTYRPIEIIVVDAGSTDDTRAVALGYGDLVRYVYYPTAAPPETRNHGISQARGEFLAFLDADDHWHPEKLARQFERFKARPELGCCLTYIETYWDESAQAEAARLKDHPRAQAIPGYGTPCLLARREVFDMVGLLNPALRSADAVDWFLRAAELGVPIEVLPEVLVYRRIHGDNFTRRDVPGQRREWLRFIKARLDRQRGGLAAALPGFVLPNLDFDG